MFNPNVTATLSTAAVLLIDDWQNAADNGYGLAPWWGDVTDIALVGFECLGGILRRLVAISWFVTLLGCNVIDAIWTAYLGYRAARRMQLRLALLPVVEPQVVDLGPELEDDALVEAIATAITTVNAAAVMAPVATLTIVEPADLSQMTVKELKAMAKTQGVSRWSQLRKAELVEALAA
ncbi:MAG: Rho termination factor N-terminal domain-containing protein [Cyanobacteria bacterium P01_D01_bin.56]